MEINCQLHQVEFADEDDLVTNAWSQLAQCEGFDSGTGDCFVDVTLGTALMSVAVSVQARLQDRLIYWRHRGRRDDRRVVPGSQVLCSMLVGQDHAWSLGVAGPAIPRDGTE
jgi:hypothetical protein